MAIDIKLPELGDGIDSGDVLEVLVKQGDVIEKEQGIVEIETDKATVEVPSSHAGRITQVHVREGESVKIGEPLITLEPAAEETPAAEPSPEQPAPPPPAPEPAASPPSEAKPSVSTAAAQPQPQPAPPQPVEPAPTEAPRAEPPPAEPQPSPEVEPPVEPETEGGVIPAGPAVRRFAREVGVDLGRLNGSGPGGRITREDVLAAVRQASRVARERGAAGDQSTDAWGPVRIEKMAKIRKTIATKMHESWTTAPRVTNFDDADITELERIRQSSKADYAERGVRLTSMPFVVKAVALALKDHPLINASVDMANEQIIYKEYVNIGIAIDTERGLLVPALRDADKSSIPDIARSLATIADRVRSGQFSVEDLRGSSFTISNLGAIGGTYSTPIINVPEVAILLLGRSRKMPVILDDEIVPRLMMPLSISYDHRLVDGATAARFLNDVIGYLEAPSRLLLAP